MAKRAEKPPAIPIPMEGDLLHRATAPFCYDPSCLCHEDPLLIAPVAQAVEAGLLTPEEASAIVAGKSLSHEGGLL